MHSYILEDDQIVRVSPRITEHHKDEWVLQIIHSAVEQTSLRIVWVQRVRLPHFSSASTRRPGHDSGSVDVLQPILIWV